MRSECTRIRGGPILTKPLWADERIAVCAGLHSEGCYGEDGKQAAEFRIKCALKEMRGEYEAELTRLRAESETAVADAIDEMAGMAIPPKSVRSARIIVGEDEMTRDITG